MSMTQTTTERNSSDSLHCPQCNAVLPPHAVFCGTCGERVEAKKISSSLLQDDLDIASRYRITSLVRRRPYVSLFFALDNQQQRTVAISDIDISSLDSEAQANATNLVQREYDLLRRQHVPYVLPIIQLGYREGHLYVIAGNPFVSRDGGEANGAAQQTEHTDTGAQLRTLHNLLQSGIGLPSEQVAVRWIEQLCRSVECLHSHHIVIGDLDPETLVLSSDRYESQPVLMLSWLPAAIRSLFPAPLTSDKGGSFSAPEVQLGRVEPRSDVYSLGAILYLLLTGVPPDEPDQRARQRLRSARELNPRVSVEVDDIVMRALSFERSERFQDALSMAEALDNPNMNTRVVRLPKGRIVSSQPFEKNGYAEEDREVANMDTIPVTPLSRSDMARWEAARVQAQKAGTAPEQQLPTTPAQTVSSTARALPDIEISPTPAEEPPETTLPFPAPATTPHEGDEASLSRRLQKRITGILPAIQGATHTKDTHVTPDKARVEPASGAEGSFFKHLQRFVLGEQQHSTAAAAIIETPMRIQPNQSFVFRIRLMGRDKAVLSPGVRKGAQLGGLSALMHNQTVIIEVRSAFYQRYAFVIQRAAVSIPAQGYAVDVTIPMPPPTSGPSGRRERMHIFFLDEIRRPLYEKPFVIELFISQHVQPGREGHQVVPIPF